MNTRRFTATKVNARIAAGRSVLTRTVVCRDESRLHIRILGGIQAEHKRAGQPVPANHYKTGVAGW